jgi:hypothetical protein
VVRRYAPALVTGAVVDRETGRRALREFHRARRRRYLEDVDWIDSLYKAYITALIAAAAIFFGSRLFGTDRVSASDLADIRRYGPAALGLVVAIAVAAGLRSGTRGGPLALEPPDVTHILLAPMPRGPVLRDAAWRQFRGVVSAGALLGAVAANLAAFRLPGNRAAWVIAGVAFGALAVLAAWGAALVASGLRVNYRLANAIGLALIVWSAADLATGAHTAPGTLLGRLALLPISSGAVAVASAAVGSVLALAVAAAGLVFIGGLSVEAAERRARLVGELRFAATLQDIRTVIVLHRQLALQLPRMRPWFRVGQGRDASWSTGARSCWTRDWQGIARWPGTRLVRQLALGLIAGAALAIVWQGTGALVIVAGIALYLAGIDATEGLAQETDHPILAAGYPIAWGRLLLRHLLVPLCVVALGEIAGLAMVALLSGSVTAVEVSAMVIVPGALAATVGGAVSVVLGSPSANLLALGSEMGLPEFGTLLVILRQTFPTALAVLAVVPVAIAQDTTTGSPIAAAAIALAAPMVAALGLAIWLRTRKLAFE